jgi:CHASE3 domain sensor protein
MEAKTTIGPLSRMTVGLVITIILTVWAAAVSYTSLRKDVEILQASQGETKTAVEKLDGTVSELVRSFDRHVAQTIAQPKN